MPTSDETTITFSDDIAVAQHQAEEADAVRQAEIEADRIKQEEEEARIRQRRRYALQNKIEERQRMIEALLERLIVPDTTKAEQAVIAQMLATEYISVLDMIPDYKDAGGEMYGIDRGLFRKYFDR